MRDTNYDDQYIRIDKKDDDVQFHTVDDILNYYAERHGSKIKNGKEALN
ncbi:hypothetical protein [Paenibacillus sp. GCM10028914]